MKAVLLNGSLATDETGEHVCKALMAQLQCKGWDVEHFALCESRIGNCAGDFFCFIRTPGVCNVNDDNRLIAEALASCDLMVYLTPVKFGGFSSMLKRMVDHQIQNISPFFARVAGETHHARRYKQNPNLLVVGWMNKPDANKEAVFRHLVQRLALNWHSKTWVSDVILTNQSHNGLHASAHQWVDDIEKCKSTPMMELPTTDDLLVDMSMGWVKPRGGDSRSEIAEIKRASLLIGSPKTRKSTSNSLGGYLFEQLTARSIQTETFYIHTVLRNPQKMQRLLDAVDASDLVTLAFPLYCDSLPAPVIEALERIAAHRQERDLSRRQFFSAIANCGFPEAYQCDTALAICQIFAQHAGFEWAGALALGGGGMVDGYPLSEGGGKTMRMRQALDMAAEGLVENGVIPMTAREGLAKPIVPHWLYWLISWNRWNQDAKGYGVNKLLKSKPYQKRTS